MMENVSNWFVGLSQREKALVAIAGLLLVAVTGYYGVIKPLSGAMETAEKRYVDAVERQGRIDSKIAALKQPLGEETVKYSGAIDSFVSQSAGETGIAVGSITPQSENRVNMVVESAKPVAFFGWLARIERQGVSVETLSISPSGNEAISATLTLRSH